MADDLASLKRRVDKNESGLESKIEKVVQRLAMGGNSRQPFNHTGVGPRPRPLLSASNTGDLQTHRDTYKEDRYWRARRSLRMWPVRGPDLKSSLTAFFRDTLMLDDDIVATVPQLEIRGVRSTKSKIVDEVIVVFPDLDIRDAVRAAAYNLAGASSAGIRLEIPESLRQSLRAVSYTHLTLPTIYSV